MIHIFRLTVTGGIVLLTLSIWPGVLELIVVSPPWLCLSLPFLGCWFVGLIVLSFVDLIRKDKDRSHKMWAIWSTLVMFVTIGLLFLHIPQRIVFAAHLWGFQAVVNEVQASQDPERLRTRQIGLYRVDVQQDSRGGVYFHTFSTADGFIDEMFHGFAYEPNEIGPPFGRSSYHKAWIIGKWYRFRASSD